MNHAQKYLAQANRHIAELTVQIVRQRVIVKHPLDTGQRSEMTESLLDALEGSLRIFEKHRIFLLRLQRIIQRPAAGWRRDGPRFAICTGWSAGAPNDQRRHFPVQSAPGARHHLD
jgi:hypothetical protein